MTRARVTGGIVLAGLLVPLSLLGGCGGDSTDDASDSGSTFSWTPVPSTPTSQPPPSEPSAISCPYEEFSQTFTPSDWTAGFIDVCVTDGQADVLLVNTSPVFLDVQSGSSSQLTQTGVPEASSFQDVVNAALPGAGVVTDGHVLVPPGGWVVASGSPASVLVGLTAEANATTYLVQKLAGYVESRLTSPSQALAKRVAGCASEVQGTWSNIQDPSVNLDYLLADTALGTGLSCGPLIADVLKESGDPPPQVATLEDEFTRLKSAVRASVVDDLVRLARNYANVLR